MKLVIIVIVCISMISSLSATSFPETCNLKTTFDSYSFIKPRPGFRKKRFAYNAIYAEFGFTYGYELNNTAQRYSLNYDLILQSGESNALTARIGYELQKFKRMESTHTADRNNIPAFVNIMFGKRYLFEMSGGMYYDLTNNKLNPAGALSFRHHNPKGGFFYRVTFTMSREKVFNDVGRDIKSLIVYGPSAAVGWSF